MILASYHSNCSVFESVDPLYFGKGNRGCKYVEFFPIWYRFIRKFVSKDEDLYIVNNASPIPVDYFVEFIDEPYEILESESSFKLSNNVKLHIKNYSNHLPHKLGMPRLLKDFLILCVENGKDFFMIEGDSLIAYDPRPDFQGKNFVVDSVAHGGSIINMGVTFIRNEFLREKLLGLDKLEELLNYCKSGVTETGFQNFFRNENFGILSEPSKFIHDVDSVTLKDFLLKHMPEDDHVKYFIQGLDAQISKKRL